jgi:hypothetical protein
MDREKRSPDSAAGPPPGVDAASTKGKAFVTPGRVLVVTSVMLTFISAWRVAAIVLCDLAGTAYYIGGIVESQIGKAAPWFILAVMLFGYAVRSVYIESRLKGTLSHSGSRIMLARPVAMVIFDDQQGTLLDESTGMAYSTVTPPRRFPRWRSPDPNWLMCLWRAGITARLAVFARHSGRIHGSTLSPGKSLDLGGAGRDLRAAGFERPALAARDDKAPRRSFGVPLLRGQPRETEGNRPADRRAATGQPDGLSNPMTRS